MKLPRSSAQAKAEGSKKYYTGKPCKYGHLSERRTNNGTCVACHSFAVVLTLALAAGTAPDYGLRRQIARPGRGVRPVSSWEAGTRCAAWVSRRVSSTLSDRPTAARG